MRGFIELTFKLHRMNIINSIVLKFRTWRTKKENHQPLSRENAYSISVLGRKGSYDDILKDHEKRVLKAINDEARISNNYLLWRYCDYITPSQKDMLINFLTNLGYQVLYTDERVILITWLWSRKDFEK